MYVLFIVIKVFSKSISLNVTANSGAPDNICIWGIKFDSGVATIVWNAVASSGTLTKAIVEVIQNLVTGTITYYISRDGGTTFTQCTLDAVIDISTTQPNGTSIVLKAVITGNAELLAIAWGGEN